MPSGDLIVAKRLYGEVLDSIRNPDSRSRAEENAKIGVACLLIYRSEKQAVYLHQAVQKLSEYDKINPNSKYSISLIEAMKLKEAGKNDG